MVLEFFIFASFSAVLTLLIVVYCNDVLVVQIISFTNAC